MFDFWFQSLDIHHSKILRVVRGLCLAEFQGYYVYLDSLKYKKFYFSCSCYFCLKKKKKEEEDGGDKQGKIIKVYYTLRLLGGLESQEGILLSESIQKQISYLYSERLTRIIPQKMSIIREENIISDYTQ